MADFFVSYTSSDRAEAHWIAQELERLGHVAHVHEWEIKGGEDIYAWMQARHAAADHVLCVVSDAYMAAPYSTLERNASLWASATRPGFVLFVVVKPCKLPSLADHYRRCEIAGLPEPEARARLAAFLADPVKGATAVWLPQTTALSNISVRVPEHFLGRDDALAAVEAALGRYEGRVAITAVHGLRGVGKTTLAAAYALRHARDYRATWWIRAQSADGMRADLVSLGVRLGWVAPDEKEAPAFEKVEQRLRHEGEGLLLIYDNAIDADSLRPFLPKGGAARVLVTSNAHAWRGLAEPVELRLWPREIGAGYFVARLGLAGERAEAEAEALSEALGGLPLAHEQAAAYCERLGVALAEYRRRFEAQPIRLLDAAKDAPAEYHDRLTVAKTFALAIEEAAELHPAAEALIVHAALLAPEPIPLFLFSEARQCFGDSLSDALADDGLDECVAALRAFALVDREAIVDERNAAIATDSVRLHKLVRRVAQARRQGAPREQARTALVQALMSVYSGDLWIDPSIWPRSRRLDPHAAEMIEGAEPAPEASALQVAELCMHLGNYRLSVTSAFQSARRYFERALAIRRKCLSPDDLEVAGSYNQLGIVLQSEGRTEEARDAHMRALAIREATLGKEAWLTGTSLNNLANALQGLNDLAGARPLRERALAIFEKTLGPEHFRTANNLNNLGVLMQMQGDLVGARPLIERALAIREKTLGPDHPHVSVSLDSLAMLLFAQADFAAARPRLERALAINEKALGPEHPETAARANNLARVHVGLGDFAAAEPLFLRAIATGEAVHGPDHPLTQRFKSNYARLLAQTARAADALPLAKAALAVHAKTNGPAHPWTKDSTRAVAEALDALGRADEAAAVRAEHGVEAR